MKIPRPTAATLIAAALLLLSPLVHAAGFWPFKDSAKKSAHTGITLHGNAQHAVRPLGNHLHAVKPLGGTRKPPKTILAKRPP